MSLRRLPERDRIRARIGSTLVVITLAIGVLVPAATTEAVAAPGSLAAAHQVTAAKATHHKKLKQRKRAIRLLSLVNAARAHRRDCGGTVYPKARPLRYDTKLADAARKFAADLGRHSYFSHTGRTGSDPGSRASAEGYRGMVGENIAAGRAGARATMRDWLRSPGHCANIMSRQYRDLGIGYANVPGSPYRTYWVQDFGRR